MCRIGIKNKILILTDLSGRNILSVSAAFSIDMEVL